MRDKDKTYIWVSVWWKTKNEIWKIYTSHIHWVARGTGTPKDRDEINRREVCECDGWVWVLEVIGDPSMLSVICKASVLVRVLPTFVFRVSKNTFRWKWNSPLVDSRIWTSETEKKRSVSRWVWRNNSLMNSPCNLPDVLTISDIKTTVVGGLWL